MKVDSAYLNEAQVAAKLGRSSVWLRAARPKLEKEGFPRVDVLIGLTCLWDVEAWIARRRQVADAVIVREHHTDDSKGVKYDRL